jgi:hypothetical protein
MSYALSACSASMRSTTVFVAALTISPLYAKIGRFIQRRPNHFDQRAA